MHKIGKRVYDRAGNSGFIVELNKSYMVVKWDDGERRACGFAGVTERPAPVKCQYDLDRIPESLAECKSKEERLAWGNGLTIRKVRRILSGRA